MKERIHITIDKEVYGKLRQLAAVSKTTISAVVNKLLRQALKLDLTKK